MGNKAKEFDESYTINSMTIENMGDGSVREMFGANAEQYPLTCVFFGDNHDQESQEFFDSLKETGTSFLQLPYGKLKTVNVDKVQKKYNISK